MSQEQEYMLLPQYENDFCRRIGVLQQLQRLLNHDATLSDVVQLVQNFQQEFGAQEQLEHVIQFLVSRSLEEQLIQHKIRLRRVSA